MSQYWEECFPDEWVPFLFFLLSKEQRESNNGFLFKITTPVEFKGAAHRCVDTRGARVWLWSLPVLSLGVFCTFIFVVLGTWARALHMPCKLLYHQVGCPISAPEHLTYTRGIEMTHTILGFRLFLKFRLELPIFMGQIPKELGISQSQI